MSIRLGLVALIWLCILGGAIVFLHVETPPATAQMPQLGTLEGDFSLEVTTTFPLEKDPFALTVDNEDQAGLAISMGAETVFSSSDLPADTPRRIKDLPDLTQGANEFVVTATPPLGGKESYAVRLRLLRGEVPVAEETFWAGNGESITGALRFDAEKAQQDSHAQ